MTKNKNRGDNNYHIRSTYVCSAIFWRLAGVRAAGYLIGRSEVQMEIGVHHKKDHISCKISQFSKFEVLSFEGATSELETTVWNWAGLDTPCEQSLLLSFSTKSSKQKKGSANSKTIKLFVFFHYSNL